MKQTPFHSRKVILATFRGAVNLLKKHLSSLHQTLNQVSWDTLGMRHICPVHVIILELTAYMTKKYTVFMGVKKMEFCEGGRK